MGVRPQITRAYDPWRSRPAAAAFEKYHVDEELTVETFDLGASLTAVSARVSIPEWVSQRRGTVTVVRVSPDIAEPTEWIRALAHRVSEAVASNQNWDSYGAAPTTQSAAIQAFLFLARNVGEGKPLPSIVPTNRGWMQVEWHRLGRDLEIRFSGEAAVDVFYEDEVSGESYDDAPLSPESPRLRRLLELTLAPQR